MVFLYSRIYSNYLYQRLLFNFCIYFSCIFLCYPQLKVNSKIMISLLISAQARNQEIFRAGDFSWNQGTFIKIQLQHKKEKPRREKITDFFCLETLKNCILNEKFYPQMTTIRAFFPKLGHFFPIFRKRQGRPPLPLPPIVTRLQLVLNVFMF